MKKNALSFFLTLILCLIFAVPAFATDVANGRCGDNLTWTFDNTGTLTISGDGDMESFVKTVMEWNDYIGGWWEKSETGDRPWSAYYQDILRVVITDGVESISSHAFYECTQIIDVYIPASVSHIGKGAFASCDRLESIYFGGDRVAWGNAAGYDEGWIDHGTAGVREAATVYYGGAIPTTQTSFSVAPSKTAVFLGHTYEVYDASLPWGYARKFCEDKDGHLVTISAEDEQNFVNSLISNRKNLYWIGLYSEADPYAMRDGLKWETNWKWVTGEPTAYTNWATNEPTGGGEHWAQLYGKDTGKYFLGEWNDCLAIGDPQAPYYTLENTGFICEYDTANESIRTSPSNVHFEKTVSYTQDQFSDVPANQWYTDSVASAFELGLMNGKGNKSFDPFGDVTIAEAITMAARIHSIYTTGGENFNQSEGSVWYQTYLDYAFKNSIISRAYYNCDATQKANRSQFAEIFAASLPAEALAAMNEVNDGVIPDVDMSSDYANAVYRLYRAGILTGNDANGTFAPQTYITRAESAAIVSRMAESSNRKSITLR